MRLPLFPLPVVLLPGRTLPLHIFEERYRRMVALCVESRSPFGIVYHDPDLHGPFLMEEGRVGTEARIEAFQLLPDGRSMILTRGASRFRIRDGSQTDALYYEARVDDYPDVPSGSLGGLLNHRRRSIQLFREALAILGEDVGSALELDAEGEVSYALAASLDIDPAWLQALLELSREGARLDRLDVIFRAVVAGGNPPGAGAV